jgi:uncharacterized Zn finger protein
LRQPRDGKKCPQCGSRTYLARTTIKSELIKIPKIPFTACQECGDEQIGQLVQKKIDKILDRAAKGKLKTGMVVL